VAAPADDGRVLVALADRLALLDADDESLETLARFPHDDRFRTNDGACDARGRFWIGTTELRFAPCAGALYRYDGRLERVLEDVTLSNGLGWTPDDARMYYVDTLEYCVDVFDFDLVTTAAPDGSVYVADAGVRGPPARVFHTGAGSRTAPSDADATSAR
jgi:sugar lactone lactonase YvrE